MSTAEANNDTVKVDCSILLKSDSIIVVVRSPASGEGFRESGRHQPVLARLPLLLALCKHGRSMQTRQVVKSLRQIVTDSIELGAHTSVLEAPSDPKRFSQVRAFV